MLLYLGGRALRCRRSKNKEYGRRNEGPSRGDKELCFKKKSIHFNETVRARPTMHLHNYMDEEITACRYGEFEYSKIDEENKFIVQRHRQAAHFVYLDESKYSIGGLEHRMDRLDRERTGKNGIHAVLFLKKRS